MSLTQYFARKPLGCIRRIIRAIITSVSAFTQKVPCLCRRKSVAPVVLKQPLEKLVCDFSMSNNDFAWQAFTRGCDSAAISSTSTGPFGPLSPIYGVSLS